MKKLKFLLLVAVIFTIIGTEARAQIADQPCDTQFWRQMHAKAWMEAEREIMQNKNLIFKPDSVFEYTCFDQMVAINAEDGGNIFVHTDYFGGIIIPRGGPNSLDGALTAVVSDSLNNYHSENFSHNYLGGRGGSLNMASANTATFRNANVPVTSYTCTVMADVWRASKCMNFIDNGAFENTDGFYPFAVINGFGGNPDIDGYAGGIQDTRNWPSACNAPAFGPGGDWSDQIELATNTSSPELYPFQTPLGQVYTDVNNMTRAGNCGPAILTGIEVVTGNNVAPFPDGVCTNPGCTYNRNGSCN